LHCVRISGVFVWANQVDATGPLPRGFVALEARGARELACTTHELNALNARLKDAANDCMLLTEQVPTARCMLARILATGLAQRLMAIGMLNC
jgi:hypothetical protein